MHAEVSVTRRLEVESIVYLIKITAMFRFSEQGLKQIKSISLPESATLLALFMKSTLSMNLIKNQLVFWLALIACPTPFVTSPTALIIGFLLATLGLVPHDFNLAKITKKLLAYSIVGLGFGIHFNDALAVTSDGIGLIVATIVGTLLIGWWTAKAFKLDKKTGYLICSGTAICGGSAISSRRTAIKANDGQIGLSLATVFVLNSLALFIFPVIGHAVGLDQHTFGTWAAIAIHDTSSVVGAASAYGEEALTTATTLKLARDYGSFRSHCSALFCFAVT